jgi:uncharacterized protein (DUF1330 family)
MSKGYWIAFVRVTDPDAYASYQALAPEAFAKFGARFLARGGDATPLEGEAWQRHVVVEFESKALQFTRIQGRTQQTVRCLHSEYCDR